MSDIDSYFYLVGLTLVVAGVGTFLMFGIGGIVQWLRRRG